MNVSEESVFAEALDKQDPRERAAFLERACAGNASLRHEVESLLSAYDAGQFLECPATAPAESSKEPIAERPGTVIGPYRLMEQIGEGGMGLVFVAEQQQPVRRKVALKVLKPGMDTRQVIARFEAERQALALMDHPNIATVHDGGETGSGRPYFVMELVKGVPITEFCDENRLTPRERLELFVHVCQAVQHAHQKGIIHRDIKPSNVLVASHDGVPVVKIIDFGVAKAIDQRLTDKTLYTQFAQLIGTPLYMSPEQAGQSALDVDTRSDIYSLGVLLYELLTGTTPFDKDRLHQAGYEEVRRIIREEEPPRPSTRISTLGKAATTVSTQRKSDPKRLCLLFRGELDWIVMKALEKDRNRRYETASAFAADVQRYLNDEPVQACPPSAWYRSRKFARRHQSGLASAGLILFVIAMAGAGVGWVMRDRAAREEGIERDRLARELALDQAVDRAMDETGDLIKQTKWSEALAVADRADKLLAVAGRNQRPARLVELRKDLSMAERLEQIYREPKGDTKDNELLSGGQGTEPGFKASWKASDEEFFRGREQDARFAGAFRGFGIDLGALAPAEAAALIGRTSIRPALIKALDEWAMMRKRARGNNDPFWKKLIEVARQADPDAWRNQVREALLRRDRPALERLADAVPLRDVSPATVYLLGYVLMDLGALDKALAVLREAQRHHPEDFWLNDVLGWLCKAVFRPQRSEEALRYYTAALALRPGNIHVHRAVAELLEDKGTLDQAVAEYTKVLELDPKNVQLWWRRAWAYRKAHQYAKALADYSKAIELEPRNGGAWYRRGWTYYQIHEYGKAIADSNRAIDLDPRYQLALNGLAWFLVTCPDPKLRDPQRAVELAKRAVALAPAHPVYWNTLGTAQYRAGQWKAAIQAQKKSADLDKQDHNCNWFILAMAFWQLGEKDKARQWYDRAVQWMEENQLPNEELHRFRVEAAELLGVEKKQQQAKSLR